MRAVWCSLLLFCFTNVFAQTQVFNSLLQCEKEPSGCIAYTEKALQSAKLYSFQWYYLKNLNLAAHWQIMDMGPLRDELPQLVKLEKAPAVFRVTVLTIYSKLLIGDGNISDGKKLVDEVIELIQDVNAVSLSPDRYAELIILLNAVSELDKAQQVGQELLGRFQKSRRDIELGDFYTALGHTQFFLENYPEARRYYQDALNSFIAMQHILEMSNTRHNIARSYQAMKQFDKAIPQFEKALKLKARAGKDSDPRNEQYTRLRYVESLIHLGQMEKAANEFKKIRLEHVLTGYQSFYEEISNMLKRAN